MCNVTKLHEALKFIAENTVFPANARAIAKRLDKPNSDEGWLRGALAVLASDDDYSRPVRLFAHNTINRIYGTTETLEEADAVVTAAVARYFRTPL